MSAIVLSDQTIWFDGYDLTTSLNSVALDTGVDAVDNTTFGDTNRSSTPGLFTVTAQVEGFFETAPDAALNSSLGFIDKPLSFGDGQSGVVYSFLSTIGDYSPMKNSVGDLISYSAGGKATRGPLIRGKLAFDGVGIAASGNGADFALGNVPAGKKLYAVMHVTRLVGSAPSLQVSVQGSGTGIVNRFLIPIGKMFVPLSQGGSPTPVDRIVFNPMSAIGSQWVELPGPDANDTWRVHYTLSGITAADFKVILAIR